MANLTKIFDKYKYDHTIVKKSKTWFHNQVDELAKKRITPANLMMQESNNLTKRLIPGNMYLFFYNAKHKETLPYWDRFPLCLPFDLTKDGFIGLNLHYLPHRYRVMLLDRLMDFANNKAYEDKTKLSYSWATIKGVSKFKIAEPCVKRYLTTHVESMFLKIPFFDWHTAMMLPLERFQKSTKTSVWYDSTMGRI